MKNFLSSETGTLRNVISSLILSVVKNQILLHIVGKEKQCQFRQDFCKIGVDIQAVYNAA